MESKTAQQNGKSTSKAGTTANGAANGKSSSATNSEANQPAAEQLTDKETEKQPEAHAEPAPVLSVEDKIRKVNTLNDLIAKRGVLKSHIERVEALKFGDYEEKDTITITSATGQSYGIKSSTLCQKIGGMLKEEISAKIAEVEAQISF